MLAASGLIEARLARAVLPAGSDYRLSLLLRHGRETGERGAKRSVFFQHLRQLRPLSTQL